MRSSVALIISTFVAAAAAQANYTLPAGFNIALITQTTLCECIQEVKVPVLSARMSTCCYEVDNPNNLSSTVVSSRDKHLSADLRRSSQYQHLRCGKSTPDDRHRLRFYFDSVSLTPTESTAANPAIQLYLFQWHRS
jgi:hypothetical protein